MAGYKFTDGGNAVTLDKSVDGFFVNAIDLVNFSSREEGGRSIFEGTLVENGSFHVSFETGTGAKPQIEVNRAVINLRDSDAPRTGTTISIRKFEAK